MKTTQTATANKPNLFLQTFAVFIAAVGITLTILVIAGTFLNI